MDDFPRALVPALRPLEEWVSDPEVTEVFVNGPDDVWIRRGAALERVPADYPASRVRVLADAVARLAGADDEACTFGRRFPEGISVEVVRPPAAPDGPVVTLIRSAGSTPTADDLVASGGLDDSLLRRIEAGLAAGAGLLVTGPEARTRRSLLAALAGLLPSRERVVMVGAADAPTPELRHLVLLTVDEAEGHPRRALLDTALRLRPERLVLDDVGAAELAVLLVAGGEPPTLAALRAVSADEAVERTLALPRATGALGPAAAALLPTAFRFVVVAAPGGGAVPRVAEVAAVGAGPDGAVLEPLVCAPAAPQPEPPPQPHVAPAQEPYPVAEPAAEPVPVPAAEPVPAPTAEPAPQPYSPQAPQPYSPPAPEPYSPPAPEPYSPPAPEPGAPFYARREPVEPPPLEDTGPVQVAPAEPPRQPRIRREVSGIHRNMDTTWDDAAPGDDDKTGELMWRQQPAPEPEPEPRPEDPWGAPPAHTAQEATNIIRTIPEGILDDD